MRYFGRASIFDVIVAILLLLVWYTYYNPKIISRQYLEYVRNCLMLGAGLMVLKTSLLYNFWPYIKGGVAKGLLDLAISISCIAINKPDKKITCICGSVDGCITPADRGNVDILKILKLKTYLSCLINNGNYGGEENKKPIIIISTGRSQGYVELLCQVLGLSSGLVCDTVYKDISFVIENGAALYNPVTKTTKCILNTKEKMIIEYVRYLMHESFKDNVFEPKSFMVTINPVGLQKIDDLKDEVNNVLEGKGRDESVVAKIMQSVISNNSKHGFIMVLSEIQNGRIRLKDFVRVENSNTSVDISIKGRSKSKAFFDVMDKLNERHKYYKKESTVYIAESSSDMEIIGGGVGAAYCSEEAPYEIRQMIAEKFGKESVKKEKDIDLFIDILEKYSGVKIVGAYMKIPYNIKEKIIKKSNIH